MQHATSHRFKENAKRALDDAQLQRALGTRDRRRLRRIVAGEHELASHGFDHYRADSQTEAQFRHDVKSSKALLEDIGGVRIIGYRAPTFSAGCRAPWVHRVLAEEGFRYSSSVYPVVHDLYGEPGAPRRPFRPRPDIIEIPLTTLRLFGRNFPSSGGGYFRLLPYCVSRWALEAARRELMVPSIFYMHPWEIDPDQPRQMAAPRRSRVRHYLNLTRTEARLRRLLRDFAWTRMDAAFLASPLPPPLVEAWTGQA